jgi:predicted DNA-binding antitoxin AbrB/MazE fold protein
MTTQVIEAIFENGLLKPLIPLENVLTEGQQVKISIEVGEPSSTPPPEPKVEEAKKETVTKVKTYKSVAEFRNSPEYNDYTPPQFGSAKGSILYMAEDFDAPLEDFEEYM